MYIVLGISFLSDLSLVIQILIVTLNDVGTRWVKTKEALVSSACLLSCQSFA